MGDARGTGSIPGDRVAPERRRGGAVLPRPVHAVGAGGNVPPLAGGAARGPGAAVPRGEPADGRLDDDGDARGALAPPRRGRLSAAARPATTPRRDGVRLTIGIPVKGRLR